jgi:hypothetical protein
MSVVDAEARAVERHRSEANGEGPAQFAELSSPGISTGTEALRNYAATGAHSCGPLSSPAAGPPIGSLAAGKRWLRRI